MNVEPVDLMVALRKLRAAVEAERSRRAAQDLAKADPYNSPVWIQGHSHSEPVCAWPDCQTYLTREQMAEAQDSVRRVFARINADISQGDE